MKKIVSFLFLLVISGAYAQHSIIPQAAPAYFVDNSALQLGYASGGTVTNPGSIIAPAANTNLAFPGTEQLKFTSGQRVELHEGLVISPSGNGRFQALIAPPQMDIAIFNPVQASANQTIAYQNEKFEIGIHLPQLLFDDVEAFCNQTANYPTPVNPFNPEELNVYAEFTRIFSNNTGLQYPDVSGFYYREFERIETGPPVDWDWNPLPTDYTFRIRFAPPFVGRWRVQIKVVSASRGNFETTSMNFECLPPSDPNNKGLIHTVPGKRYLELGNDFFFPIGQNLPEANPHGPDWRWGHGPYGWETINAIAYIDQYHEMEDLAAAGGNYFRFMTMPWTTEIEFEKVNDYSGRMTSAWEMDRLLDKCMDLDLYLHLNMMYATALEKTTAYNMFFWDWYEDTAPCTDLLPGAPPDIGYCYHSQLGLATPQDFLTDANAKKFFKYRLRYMISRYGYSRNIAMFELANEANNIGSEYELEIDVNGNCRSGGKLFFPYEDANFIAQLSQWQTEMVSYMQNEVYNHDHIITVNFVGKPDADDNTFSSAPTNINTYNLYNSYLNRTEDYFTSERDYGLGVYARPIFYSETGAPNEDGCSNSTEWVRTFWMVPFSGAAGGLNWPASLPDLSVYPHIQRLRDYLDGVDLNDGEWMPDYNIQLDNMAETIHLKHQEGLPNNPFDKAIGVVINRTYNAYSMRTCNNCACTYGQNPANNIYPPNFPATDISFNPNSTQKLKLENMGVWVRYTIEWTDIMNGTIVMTDDKFSQLDGDLILEYPDLIMETTPIRPILAFKVHRYNQDFNERHAGIVDADSTVLVERNQPVKNQFSIYPNPAVENFEIQPSDNQIIYSVELYSTSGKLVWQTDACKGARSVNTNLFESGTYFVVLKYESMTERKRIVIIKP